VAGSEPPPVPAANATRLRRGPVFFAALLGTAALVLWALLAHFAADLFRVLVDRAAATSGLEISFDEVPVLSARGFLAQGLRLRAAGGEDLLRAESVTGHSTFSWSAPHLALALEVRGARAHWPAPGAAGGAQAHSTDLLPAWPSILSSLSVLDARVDFGAGMEVALDGILEAAGEGGVLWTASRIDFTEASGERAAEKLAGRLRLEPGADSSLRFDLKLEGGAALVDSLLLDFAAQRLEVSGGLRASSSELAFRDLSLRLGKILDIEGEVDLTSVGGLRRADLRASSDDLMPLFVTFVRDPFGGVAPALAEASLQGRGSVALRLDSTSRHAVDATLKLSLSGLRTRAVEADKVEIDLPWMGAARSARDSRSGRLRAGRLQVLALPWSGLDAAVQSFPGRLRAKAPIESRAFGGKLRLSDLTFEDDAKEGPRLGASLTLEAFDLAEVARALGAPGLSGTVRGNLGRVRVDARAVRAEGSVEAEAFGGRWRFSGLSVEEPFSRVPSFGLDATCSEVDLARLTEALGLGRVQGVLEGKVTHLVIANGQPQSFDADLHSVPRKGVPQNIDVKAIVQLGVLGGADGGSVTGTLLKMVDRYRYSDLGLRARLRNDVFELRGVRSEGGKDYLVKGSFLPPSVSVVSHSQVISFSEMLRRIQRIADIGEGGTPNASNP
jgi:hypothetical protein